MKIDSYSFGRLVVDGRIYTSDVILYPERIDASWWRKEGHRLEAEDLAEVVAARPHILIIGTGYSGVMTVPRETLDFLAAKGIIVRVERTGTAVEAFNKLQGKTSVIAALHLTC